MAALDLEALAAQQRGRAVKLAAEFGFHVFPADHPALKRCAGTPTTAHDPDTCEERGKHPVPSSWAQWATDDVQRLATGRYFGGPRPRNIATACRQSRLLILDEDKLDELARFLADHGLALPATVIVRTHNGFHYYFRAPRGVVIGNSEGAFADYGINVRGPGDPDTKCTCEPKKPCGINHGGYVIAPGSMHASGTVYALHGDVREIAPAPEWLLEALKRKSASKKDGTDTNADTDSGAWWRVGAIPPSKRHPAVIAAAGWCNRMGMKRHEAIPTLDSVFRRFEGDKYTWEQVLAKYDDVCKRYAAGYRMDLDAFDPDTGDALPDEDGEPQKPDLEGSALDIAIEAQKLRVRRAAQRLVNAEDRPPVKFPEVLTLTERLARPLPPAEFRIDGWQPADSRIVISAQYKAGKTTMIGNLVRSLGDGAPFLGTADVVPFEGRVGLIDNEMSARQLDQWLRDQDIVNTDRIVPLPLRGSVGTFDLLDPDTLARWAELLRDLDIKYLILDCLRPVLDALGLSEHTDAGKFLVGFDQLLADARIPDAAIVHHMGHSGERSRGDSRIRDWPDVEWRLVRESDDPASARFVSSFGRDVDVRESRLDYDPVTRHLTLAGGSRRDRGAEEALEAVLEILNPESKLSGRAIADLVKHHPRDTVRDAIKSGVDSGQIVTEDGPRRAILHSSARVSGSARRVSDDHSSECASALIGGALALTRAVDPVRGEEEGPADPEPRRDNGPPSAAYLALLEKRRQREQVLDVAGDGGNAA